MIVLFCFVSIRVAAAEVGYVISLANPERHLVQITMTIPPGAAAHELQLPVWNALYQIRDFSQYMNWIRAENLDGSPLPLTQINKGRWKIDDAGAGARVLYEMLADSPDPYGAQFNSHHGFFNLAEILVYAGDLRSRPAEVEIRNLPERWKIATPLEKKGNAYVAENYDRLVDSPVEMSAFEEQDFDATCGRYRVVLDLESQEGSRDAAKARTDLNAMIPSLQRIVAAASAWMNDCPFKNYMFIYHASNSPTGGGMEHSYSTAITLPAKDFDEVSARLLATTSHEFFHLWNVKRIRPQSLEPVDYTKENYTPALWFCEGVDSTAGEYILLHGGLLDEKHYLDHLSNEITELEGRPAHLTQSVEQSSLDAWLEKYPYYGLPERSISYYNKGELLGVVLDLTMREATDDRESLRDLFRWMNEHYAKQGRSFADSTAVRETAQNLSHADFREFFENYVAGTDEIPWDKFFARVGLQVSRSEVSFADPEFEAVQKFDQLPVVVAVQAGSDASRAGLQAGDAILKINAKSVSRDFEKAIAELGPGEMLRLSVRRDGTVHNLEWKLGGRKQPVLQLREVPGVSAQQRARRAAWLFDKGEDNPQ